MTLHDDLLRVEVQRPENRVRIELERLARGRAATIEIGNVSSGSEPSITNVGTATDAVLNFVLPEAKTEWHTDEWE